MIGTVREYIKAHGLLRPEDKCIVALSGGADSVALLLALSELGYTVEAAHCNFHLRGEESNRDEAFVKELCGRLGTRLHLAHFDTYAYASLHKVSIEMAARDLRYAYFEQLCNDIHADTICVAHHREDSVETLLINLVRGTGLHGLTGIRPRNGHIIRPLLCVGRSDIEDYLRERKQPFVIDSTNLVDDIARNKIRLDIMPLLREINPAADTNIWRTAERVGEAAKVFDHAMGEMVAETTKPTVSSNEIDIEKLKAQPSPEYLLYEILRPYGFTPQAIEQIYANIDAPTGRTFSSSDFDLAIDRGRILVERRKPAMKPLRIPETGTYALDGGARLRVEITDTPTVSRTANIATVDADKVAFPLCIRRVEAGDRFTPFGMKGSKLVSDYLTDRKRNVLEKRAQMVVADARGDIVWLVGERTDNRFRITDESLRTLRISLLPPK